MDPAVEQSQANRISELFSREWGGSAGESLRDGRSGAEQAVALRLKGCTWRRATSLRFATKFVVKLRSRSSDETRFVSFFPTASFPVFFLRESLLLVDCVESCS